MLFRIVPKPRKQSFQELAKKIKTKKLQGDFLALQFFERADFKNLISFQSARRKKKKRKMKKVQDNNLKIFKRETN